MHHESLRRHPRGIASRRNLFRQILAKTARQTIPHAPNHAFRQGKQKQRAMALEFKFTYLLGPVKIALRPRLITDGQIEELDAYCARIWDDCRVLEKMWHDGLLDDMIRIEEEELDIARAQPWRGSPAIFASDGIFSFGAHRDH